VSESRQCLSLSRRWDLIECQVFLEPTKLKLTVLSPHSYLYLWEQMKYNFSESIQAHEIKISHIIFHKYIWTWHSHFTYLNERKRTIKRICYTHSSYNKYISYDQNYRKAKSCCVAIVNLNLRYHDEILQVIWCKTFFHFTLPILLSLNTFGHG